MYIYPEVIYGFLYNDRWKSFPSIRQSSDIAINGTKSRLRFLLLPYSCGVSPSEKQLEPLWKAKNIF